MLQERLKKYKREFLQWQLTQGGEDKNLSVSILFIRKCYFNMVKKNSETFEEQ